jgi:hypothetical protein
MRILIVEDENKNAAYLNKGWLNKAFSSMSALTAKRACSLPLRSSTTSDHSRCHVAALGQTGLINAYMKE